MLKIAAPFLALLVLVTAPMAAAQTPAGPAEAFAWRSFQACVAISKGATLAKAATEAGYQLADDEWLASAGERGFMLEVVPFPALPGGKGCVVLVRGPLSDHQGFAKRLNDWAAKDGFTALGARTSPAGGQMLQFVTEDESRLLVLALFPEPGSERQPSRTSLFVGWRGQ